MSSINIVRSSPIETTVRTVQMSGMFDIEPTEKSVVEWSVNIDLPNTWNIGVIVGPSGSGKSTIARELFAESFLKAHDWSLTKSIIDGFPKEMSVRDIVEILSSVGFSSPPSWLRPFHVLSNGEQFRVTMARAIAEQTETLCVDEFTSVVDRTVAKIGSFAIAKTVRRRNQKLIVCSCHYDILDWLAPDWIYNTGENKFSLVERSRMRPTIELDIHRVSSAAWNTFRSHHYLSKTLHPAAVCFVACWQQRLVAFTSYLHFPHPKERRFKREHRTVVLPDFQGVGIGTRLSNWLGEKVTREGFRFISTTSAPSMIRHRSTNENWRCSKAGNASKPSSTSSITEMKKTISFNRLTTSWEYIGKQKPTPDV